MLDIRPWLKVTFLPGVGWIVFDKGKLPSLLAEVTQADVISSHTTFDEAATACQAARDCEREG